MNLFRKGIASVALVALMSGIFSTGVSAAMNEAEIEAANMLAAKGFINEVADAADYNLNQDVLRQEIAKVAVNVAGLTPATTCEGKFADVTATTPNDWVCGYVEVLLENDLISANENFRPEDKISKSESVKMMLMASGYSEDEIYSDVENWQEQTVAFAADKGLVESFTEYNENATRGFTFSAGAESVKTKENEAVVEDESFEELMCAITGDCDEVVVEDETTTEDTTTEDTTTEDTTTEDTTTEDTTTEDTTTEDTTTPVVTGGNVEVTLNPTSTSAGTTYPLGATAVSVAKYDMTAGDSDVSIDSVKLARNGLGNAKDFEKVYLFVDGKKATTGRTFSDSDNELNFSNLSLTIKAGSTITVDVRADIDTSTDGDGNNPSNHSNTISIIEVVSSADEALGLPVSSNTISIGSISVGGVDIEATGTSKTAKVGEVNVELGKMTVYVSSVEDAEVRSITLYNNGKDVYANPKLYRGSTLVSEGELYGDYIKFEFNEPYLIEKGNNSIFSVKSDIIGEKDDVGKLYVRYKADLEVVGKTYGYNLAVSDSALNGSASDSFIDELDSIDASEDFDVTVEAGKITLSFTGPSANDIAVDTDAVSLLEFTLTSETDVDVEKVGVDLGVTNLTLGTEATNLKLICDGSTKNEWSSPAASNTDTSIWAIKAGESKKCKVTLDIESSADLNDTVFATLNISNFIFKDMNGDTVTDVIPSADIEGKTMTVQNKTITITKASTPVSNSFVKGTQAVETAGFVFSAGKASDVKVTDIAFTVQGKNADLTLGANLPAATFFADANTVLADLYADNANFDTATKVCYDVSGNAACGDATDIILKGTPTAAEVTKVTAVTSDDDFVYIDANTSADVDSGEAVYYDADGSTDVTASDIRLVAYKGFAAGSVVGDYNGATAGLGTYAADASTADISSVMLYVDGVQVGTTETISSSKVTFDNLDITIPAGSTKKVVAVANIANNAKYNKFSFDIATATDVVAEDTDGKNVTNSSTVTSTAFVSVYQGGVLNVAVDGDTTDSEIVIAGTSGVEFTKVKFSAVDEEMTLDDFDVTLSNVNLANNVLKITATAGSVTSTADVAGGIAQFRDLGIVVPKDGSVVVTFKADLNTITAGATSGNSFRLDLASTNFEAMGVSGEKQTTISAVTTGNAMTIRETKPTLAKASDSPSGTKAPGLDTVLKFTVTADSAEDVSLRGLNFNVIASGTKTGNNIDWIAALTTADFSLYESGKESDELETANTDWSIVGLSDNTAGDAFSLDISGVTDYITVTKGTTKTFVLKINTAGASAANDDTVRIDITSVDWNDSNATVAADTLPDVLPLDGNTIQY